MRPVPHVDIRNGRGIRPAGRPRSRIFFGTLPAWTRRLRQGVHSAVLCILTLCTGSSVQAESQHPDPPAGHTLPSEPIVWLPDHGSECKRSAGGRRYCQGPRRVPKPHGPAAQLAAHLGLGTRQAAGRLLHRAPPKAWQTAAGPAQEGSYLWPVRTGKLWRGFGWVKRGSRHGRQHDGLDISAPTGTPIRAAQDGLVAYSDNGIRGFGNLLVLVHGDGGVTLYAHCKAINVFPGQRVRRGQVVAQVGRTGIARGPHLHFEYRLKGRLRDPREVVEVPKPRRPRHRKHRNGPSPGRARATKLGPSEPSSAKPIASSAPAHRGQSNAAK